MYKDMHGEPCSLSHLCRTEPEWSANVIQSLTTENERMREALEELCAEMSVLPFQLQAILAERTTPLPQFIPVLIENIESSIAEARQALTGDAKTE